MEHFIPNNSIVIAEEDNQLFAYYKENRNVFRKKLDFGIIDPYLGLGHIYSADTFVAQLSIKLPDFVSGRHPYPDANYNASIVGRYYKPKRIRQEQARENPNFPFCGFHLQFNPEYAIDMRISLRLIKPS